MLTKKGEEFSPECHAVSSGGSLHANRAALSDKIAHHNLYIHILCRHKASLEWLTARVTVNSNFTTALVLCDNTEKFTFCLLDTTTTQSTASAMGYSRPPQNRSVTLGTLLYFHYMSVSEIKPGGFLPCAPDKRPHCRIQMESRADAHTQCSACCPRDW